jgi:hypothetical protein
VRCCFDGHFQCTPGSSVRHHPTWRQVPRSWTCSDACSTCGADSCGCEGKAPGKSSLARRTLPFIECVPSLAWPLAAGVSGARRSEMIHLASDQWMLLVPWGRLRQLFSHWYVWEVGAASQVAAIHQVPLGNASSEDAWPEPRSSVPVCSRPNNDPREADLALAGVACCMPLRSQPACKPSVDPPFV